MSITVTTKQELAVKFWVTKDRRTAFIKRKQNLFENVSMDGSLSIHLLTVISISV